MPNSPMCYNGKLNKSWTREIWMITRQQQSVIEDFCSSVLVILGQEKLNLLKYEAISLNSHVLKRGTKMYRVVKLWSIVMIKKATTHCIHTLYLVINNEFDELQWQGTKKKRSKPSKPLSGLMESFLTSYPHGCYTEPWGSASLPLCVEWHPVDINS